MIIQGELEIDQKRGVIYFHSAKTGRTVLRICRVPMQRKEYVREPQMDITYGVGFYENLDQHEPKESETQDEKS